jgi:hypothetical protein
MERRDGERQFLREEEIHEKRTIVPQGGDNFAHGHLRVDGLGPFEGA